MTEFEYVLKVEDLSKLKTKAAKIKAMSEFNLLTLGYAVWDLNLAIYMINNFEGLPGWSNTSRMLSMILRKVPNEILIRLHSINEPKHYTKPFLNSTICSTHPAILKIKIIKIYQR